MERWGGLSATCGFPGAVSADLAVAAHSSCGDSPRAFSGRSGMFRVWQPIPVTMKARGPDHLILACTRTGSSRLTPLWSFLSFGPRQIVSPINRVPPWQQSTATCQSHDTLTQIKVAGLPFFTLPSARPSSLRAPWSRGPGAEKALGQGRVGAGLNATAYP